MNVVGYALVRLEDGAILARITSLPFSAEVPGENGIDRADIDKAGAEIGIWSGDEFTPRYRMVERVCESGTPDGHRIASESDEFDGTQVVVARIYEPAPAEPRLVSKKVIVDRLYAAGKLDAARAALDATDLYTQERWNCRDSIYSDDPTAIALLTAIGADPAVILAP